jgi:putative endonuclease
VVSSRAHHLPRHLLKGRNAENRAKRFLETKGLAFVEANYHCRSGEIDLIMREQSTVVFVEVRYRKNEDFGGALESIDFAKQRKLRATAEHYLQRHRIGDEQPCRFDVVLITGDSDGRQVDSRIDWIRDAL